MRAIEKEISDRRDEVVAVCQAILGNREDAEDAAHDAILKAWVGANADMPTVAFRRWLFRIARNTALNLLAERKRKMAGEVHDTIANGKPRPEENAIRQEYRDLLAAQIDALPRAYKKIVRLYLEGLSIAEIADRMDIRYDSAKTLLSRARQILKRNGDR